MGSICGRHETSPQQDLRGNMMRKRSEKADIDDVYVFDKAIGQGSMGAVAAIRKKDTGQVYALKTIQLNRVSREMRLELRNEINILMSLDHPNIIKPLELFERKRQMYFVMEMCSGGDLFERIPYSEKQAAHIVNQITSAVRYLHSKNICHRDLKFENVLYESHDDTAVVKLIDFGLSKQYRPGRRMNEAVGTLYSMAPEVLHGNYTQACDMWSIGVIAFMLLSGEMPFTGRNEALVIRKIENARFSTDGPSWKGKSDAAKLFVKKLIRLAPEARLTAVRAIEDEWLAKEWTEQRRLTAQLSDRSMGESIVSSLKNYGSYGKLRKAALMVIAHRSDSQQVRRLRNAFLEIDTHREGFITLEELQQVLVTYDISAEEIAKIFDGVDVDKSHKVSYTEFLAATVSTMGAHREEQLAEAFDRLDADDSGFISRENLKELLGTAYTAADVDRMINEGDFKRNGQVDFDEFMALMTEQTEKEVTAVSRMSGTPPREDDARESKSSTGSAEDKGGSESK